MLFDSIWKEIQWKYKFGTPLIKIIFINVFVFLFINFFSVVDYFTKQTISTWLVSKFAFLPTKQFIFQPWSILTYQFIHTGFFHILFNMLWLYWFGSIIQDLIGEKKIFPLYILGGFFGAIFYAIISFIVQYTNPLYNLTGLLLGASAGVMAITFATATLSPNYEIRLVIFGNVKIKWIALLTLVLDITMLDDGNFGGHIAHLGGALFGWIYINRLRNGKDMAVTFYKVVGAFAKPFKRKETLKVVFQQPKTEKKEKVVVNIKPKEQQKQSQAKAQRDLSKREKQEILDTILDKINSSGYDSLTASEKEFLFKMSRED